MFIKSPFLPTHITILNFLNIAWGSVTFLHFECVGFNYIITVLYFNQNLYVLDTLEDPNYFDFICFFCNHNLSKLGVRYDCKNLFRRNSIFYRIRHELNSSSFSKLWKVKFLLY